MVDLPAGVVCDFAYHEEGTFSAWDAIFFDGDGNYVRDTLHYTSTILHENVDTGYALTETIHGSETFTEATQTFKAVGITWLLKDSTGRVVVAHAGLLTFDVAAFEIIHVTPNFPTGFSEILCPALGGNPA